MIRPTRPAAPLRLVGLAALLPVGWWLWGLPGVVAGGVLAFAGAVVSPVTIFAAGHVLLAAAPPEALPELVAFELALGLAFVGDPAYWRGRVPVPAIAAPLFVVFAWLAVELARAESVTVAAVVLLVGLGGLGYAIHRYELVQLGLVTEAATADGGE